MKISLIVAMGRNREIGAKNKLLWKIPEELKRFKEITTGHSIIMGRKTHESIGRVLPNRTNIVITRDTTYEIQDTNAGVVHSLEEAISYASSFRDNEVAKQSQQPEIAAGSVTPHTDIGNGEIFIIGGAQIFAEALPLADKLYVTLVDADFPEADSFFPEYEDKFTKKVFEQDQESAGYKYKFLELEP